MPPPNISADRRQRSVWYIDVKHKLFRYNKLRNSMARPGIRLSHMKTIPPRRKDFQLSVEPRGSMWNKEARSTAREGCCEFSALGSPADGRGCSVFDADTYTPSARRGDILGARPRGCGGGETSEKEA